jgi:hypothetical protein
MPLIEKFLPHYQFSERHGATLNCTPGEALNAVMVMSRQSRQGRVAETAMSIRIWPARLLHWISPRQFPPPARVTPVNFLPLGRDGDLEMVGGLVGKFWRPDFGLRRVESPTEFLACNPPRTAKLVLGFAAEQVGAATWLTTETRVYCPDRYSLIMFTPYWLIIRPVSGLLRRRALGNIRRIAEASGGTGENS